MRYKKMPILEYLEMLPEPERSHAISNISQNRSKRTVTNLKNALICAFDWELSDQGFHYWNAIYENIK